MCLSASWTAPATLPGPRVLAGQRADVGLGISLYSTGNVYLTGWFQGTVDFDPGIGITNLTSSGGSYDVYVSKLDSNGDFVWAKAMGGISEDIGQAVTVDSLGNVYTTGWFIGTADFDPGLNNFPLVSTGNASDIFISKLTAAATLSGQKPWAGPQPMSATALPLILPATFTPQADSAALSILTPGPGHSH